MSNSILVTNDDESDFLPIIHLNENEDGKDIDSIPKIIPILPLRNTVLFPGIVIPITVGRDKSLQAVNEAYKSDKFIGVITQKDANKDDLTASDLYAVGTIAKIIKRIKMPDGGTTIIFQGKYKFKIIDLINDELYLKANIELIHNEEINEKTDEFKALLDSIKDLSNQIVKNSPNIPTEASIVLKNIENPHFLMNFVSSNLNANIEEKQKLLEFIHPFNRAEYLIGLLHKELNFAELKNKVHTKTKVELDKQQREYFLQQQLKSINEELGNENNDKEITEMKSKAEKKNWTENAKLLFDKGIKKLERMHSFSPDYSVVYNHLDLLLELPWNDITTDNYDLQNAKQVLEDDHYGMQKIKNRIIEFLAVLKLKGDLKSPILCLLGPPGIGKTSLGRSIARALDRKYIRISLGGLHDESEIRGHRKTYIGAMPGRIIQSLKKCKTSNPVMILDEIDKIGNDFKGDPSSALLEVLDPEQNHSFYDNYLETEYDLSKVLFIATANNIQNIQPALRDRLEIIELSGYATEEKIEIAKKHLLPKQQEAHGLKDFHFNFPDKIYETIIQQYTRESGVRELDRKLATLLRYIAKEFVISNTIINDITEKDIKDILGISKFAKDIYKNIHVCGVVTGLAWTYTGGDILFIETILSKGKGNIQLTGNLGNVMKESAHTALSYLQANAEKWNIDNEKFTTNNIHIHVPEGATPKDGPSAGITMFTSIASAFTGRLVKPKLAMTGEITLRGQVIPVGGIKEKILAAKREGFKEIILCAQNEKDIAEIEKNYIKNIKFHYVNTMEEVLKIALL